ncbi:MAG TPA: dephospho-CoA kinase [Bacteroidales bacterium]|nr:dephospho-CoA kinase [Bacteroidales bacterium]HCI56431.1 dephospho-CoA kinase [Bacteroidales bacterium]HRC89834.1 dephospho-CoA kinase [Bacteroidales bacterium]
MKLGITGGIGSGKTVVCKVFNILGAPVFYADEAARIIMDNDINVMERVNEAVGKNVYPNGSLDRKELAKLIFNNEDLLQKINQIVHPEIFRNFIRWAEKSDYPYVILEAAILFESGADKFVDRILTVAAPAEERIKRVIESKNLSRQEVIERMRNQWDDSQRIKKSHYVINNSGNELIIPSIIKIHRELLGI